MKRNHITTVVLLTALAVPSAHASFFSSFAHIVSHIPFLGSYVDKYADQKAHKKVDENINSLYQEALRCRPLEYDGRLTVKDFIKMKPGYPDWKTLEKFEAVATSARNQAITKSKNDKVRHCFAGCLVSRNLGYSSGVLAAFSKELKDASDCNPSTHFELQDYYATIAGAIAAAKTSCDQFCGSARAATLSGTTMLSDARTLQIQRTTSTYSNSRYYRMVP